MCCIITLMTFVRTISLRFHMVGIFIVVGLLFMGPLIINTHASAQPVMDHNMKSSFGCISGCISNNGSVLQKDSILIQEEKFTPIPPPDKPDYLQFQNLSFPNPLPPQDLITSPSFKPPDLILLNALFRF